MTYITEKFSAFKNETNVPLSFTFFTFFLGGGRGVWRVGVQFILCKFNVHVVVTPFNF